MAYHFPYIEDTDSELSDSSGISHSRIARSGISHSRITRSGINHSNTNRPSDTIRKDETPMVNPYSAPYVESPAPPPMVNPYSAPYVESPAPPPMGGPSYYSDMPPPDVEYAEPAMRSYPNRARRRPVYVEVASSRQRSRARSYARQRGYYDYTGGDPATRHLERSVLCMTTDDFSLAGEQTWSADHVLDLRLPEAERTFEHPGYPKESDFDAIRINSWPVLRALARLPTIAATVTPKSAPHVFWAPFLPLTENLSQLEKYLTDLKDELAKKQVALPLRSNLSSC